MYPTRWRWTCPLSVQGGGLHGQQRDNLEYLWSGVCARTRQVHNHCTLHRRRCLPVNDQTWHVSRHVQVVISQQMPRCTTNHRYLCTPARRLRQHRVAGRGVHSTSQAEDFQHSKYLHAAYTNSILRQGFFTLKMSFLEV